MTPKQAASLFVAGKLNGLGKIQSTWNAYQWTEYSNAIERLNNTEWHQYAVKRGIA